MLGSTKEYLGRSSHYKMHKRCNREVDILPVRDLLFHHRSTYRQGKAPWPAIQNSEHDEKVMRKIRSLGCNLPAPFLRVANTHQIRCRRCLAKNAKHAKKKASLKPIVVVDRRGSEHSWCCVLLSSSCDLMLYLNTIQAYLPNHGTWFHF